MSDMDLVTAPKSDQKNYEDFLGGKTLTIKVTKVTIKAGEQPVTVNYEGDNGKPYKPCKSMCKVMVIVWGNDSAKYAGRSMTLYGDPTVTWGGMAVGGIRISHMSHIDKPITMALAATRSSKKLFTVNPLAVQSEPKTVPSDQVTKPLTISTDQNKLLRTLLTTNKIDPGAFKSYFGIESSLELLASQMDDARSWIDTTVTAANEAAKE